MMRFRCSYQWDPDESVIVNENSPFLTEKIPHPI